VILAGNHTTDALEAEGFETVRCEVITCTDDEARRVNIADNRLGELPGPDGNRYDDDALVELLSYLDEDYEGTGWTAEDVEALITPPEDFGGGSGDPDDVPEPPAEPVSVLGDLYILGAHRLLCGDATNPDHLARVTEGLGTPGIVYTDPPYGVAIVSSAGKVGATIGYPFGGAKNGKQGSAGTVKTTPYLPVAGDDSTQAAADAYALLSATYPDAFQVWWGGNHYAASAGLPDASCWLVWDKDTNGNFADAELAWTNHPGAVRLLRHMWNGMLRASEHGKRVHPTQKPCALAEWAFGVIDPKNERKIVLDAFGGSGSTLIAAHQTGRTAALLELEPAYVDTIAKRFQHHTGIKPERVLEDGTTEPASFD
jgi:16S rRNA G966 N2-methylase RsmD